MTLHAAQPTSGNLLGSGRAEQDRLLDRAFLSTPEYNSLARTTDFHVAVGRRGTGKSALFRKLQEFYQDDRSVLLLVDAAQEHVSLNVAHLVGQGCSTYEHARAVMRIVWKIAILSQVASELFVRLNTRIPKDGEWIVEHLNDLQVVPGGVLHSTVERLLSEIKNVSVQQMASDVARRGKLDKLQNFVAGALVRAEKRAQCSSILCIGRGTFLHC